MLVPVPKVNAVFEASIKSLQDDGIVPSPIECVWIYDLCERIFQPEKFTVSTWLPPAVEISWLTLFPLTIQAELWLQEYVEPWLADNDRLYVLAVAYAMAFGGKEGAFAKLTSRASIVRCLFAFGIRVPCTFYQLRSAMEVFIGNNIHMESSNEKKQKKIDPSKWGETIARVAHLSGCTEAEVLLMTQGQFRARLNAVKLKDKEDTWKDDRVKEQEALRLALAQIRELREVARG